MSKLFWVTDKENEVGMLVKADSAEEAKRIVEEYLEDRLWTLEQFFGEEIVVRELDLEKEENDVICVDTGVAEW